MIEIRKLNIEDMWKVIELKALCWREELAGLSSNVLNLKKEYEFWTNWMNAAEEHNDVRLLYGAFKKTELLGVVFGSYAEISDIPKNGIELNGLWVYPQHRGEGIALMLLTQILDEFSKLEMEQIVIYNFHYSNSNSFYRKFGCEVLRKDKQLKEELPVDVFVCDISEMNYRIKDTLIKYME